jgi:hypothetical protein
MKTYRLLITTRNIIRTIEARNILAMYRTLFAIEGEAANTAQLIDIN